MLDSLLRLLDSALQLCWISMQLARAEAAAAAAAEGEAALLPQGAAMAVGRPGADGLAGLLASRRSSFLLVAPWNVQPRGALLSFPPNISPAPLLRPHRRRRGSARQRCGRSWRACGATLAAGSGCSCGCWRAARASRVPR